MGSLLYKLEVPEVMFSVVLLGLQIFGSIFGHATSHDGGQKQKRSKELLFRNTSYASILQSPLASQCRSWVMGLDSVTVDALLHMMVRF